MESKIRILIVGGRGFLGKEISKALKEAGFNILVSTRGNLPLGDHVKLDIFSRQEVLKVLRTYSPEVVINCSWITEHATYLHSSENSHYQSAATNLFEECQKMGVGHFIGIGSAAEYYNNFKSDLIHSGNQLGSTKYGMAKRQTLRDILDLHQVDLMTFNWLRVFQPYGPGQDPKRFLPSVIRSLQTDLPLNILAPNAVRDWITTRDIAASVLHLVKLKISGTVDVGSTNGISNLEVCQKLEEIIKPQNPKFNISDNHDQSVLVASKGNILFETGWRPKDDLTAGVHWLLKGN